MNSNQRRRGVLFFLVWKKNSFRMKVNEPRSKVERLVDGWRNDLTRTNLIARLTNGRLLSVRQIGHKRWLTCEKQRRETKTWSTSFHELLLSLLIQQRASVITWERVLLEALGTGVASSIMDKTCIQEVLYFVLTDHFEHHVLVDWLSKHTL